MAFGSALVDRARVVRRETATRTRVTGSTVVAPVYGNWFRARLELTQGQESEAPQQGRKRGSRTTTLMIDRYDEENLEVEVRAEDFVQVDSEEYGFTTWQVNGSPQPIRKLRTVLGHQAQISRIEHNELVRPV